MPSLLLSFIAFYYTEEDIRVYFTVYPLDIRYF